jgi:hypothetical protein
MKKFPFFAPFIVVLLILPYFSCKSAPAAAPAQKAPQAEAPAASSRVNPALLGELNAAKAKADEARKKAADFDSSDYFPSEWDAAEDQYARANQTPQNNDANARSAIAAYNEAADAYDAVFKLAIPLYAQAREDEIVALRDNLIAAGWQDAFPESLSAADKIAVTAYEQYEAQDYYTAKDTADQALMMYQTLTNTYNALLIRNEIEERDFISYDPDNFERAEDILNEAMDDYEAGNYASAYENSNEALNRYNLVLSAGWAAHAERYALLAEAARQAALDVKADIAVRGIFSEADSLYKKGVDLYDSDKYGDAAKNFFTAENLFVTAKESTLEKRGIAAQAIEEANKKIEESDETARLAELIIEGGAE